MATFRQLVGQDLIDICNDSLAGLQNGVDSRALLTYLNEGKDELWALIKTLKDEYFQVPSQSADPTADFYFPVLTSAVREYDLPGDLSSVDFIECLTAGYTDLKFIYRKPTDPEFRAARMSANDQSAGSQTLQTFYYTIMGRNQFVLADYPPATLNVSIWYTRALPDFEASDTLDEIIFPFGKKIAEYAAKRAVLGMQDSGMFAAWKSEWRESITSLMQGAAPRNESDPTFVQEYCGDDS